MIRTVVAFATEDARNTISGLLEKSGISVRFSCRTGLEAVRAIKKMGGGVVVCGSRLPDMTADELCFELYESAFFLVVGKPSQLQLCESEDIFKLSTPLRGGELAGSVNMLLQMDERRSRSSLPKRSDMDKDLVMRAKSFVMEKNGMSEDAAYRFIQRRSMETSTPMTEIARLILNALD